MKNNINTFTYYSDAKAYGMILLVAEYVGERLDKYLEIVPNI